ncbi:MAG: von Willebrand factor type A domain-containing protein [Planctomycetota bacterium]
MRAKFYSSSLVLALAAGCWASGSPKACFEMDGSTQAPARDYDKRCDNLTTATAAPTTPDAAPNQKSPAKAEPPRDPAHAAPAAPPENEFKVVKGDDATSTFAVEVDTESYSLVRRYLRHHQLPPASLVRVEEMINRFDITDPAPPTDGKPFATKIEVAGCPWKPEDKLVRIALRGREVDEAKRPPTNLVFLIDVSGSMSSPERLPLLKDALRLLVEKLGEKDRVAMVVYAGAAGVVLPPTNGSNKAKILEALDRLNAGGSTNGGAGIELAYRTAIEGFVEGGMNRVLLCTDGDFNVGISDAGELEKFIAEKRKTGVFLSCLGFGVSGYGDRTMETLADKGNGHYAAIDDLKEAKRVLVTELTGTLVTIAKDVKVQVEWNAERVKKWRLVGYENRVMANQDFKDDKKDGGEIGAGHRVTALYEIESIEGESPLCSLRLRWKAADGETSTGSETAFKGPTKPFADASTDFKFAASVAAGAMLLRHSTHAGDATWAKAIRWAADGLGQDPRGERGEWLDLLRRAADITGQPTEEPTNVREAALERERTRG